MTLVTREPKIFSSAALAGEIPAEDQQRAYCPPSFHAEHTDPQFEPPS
jgi:hypothetical protein